MDEQALAAQATHHAEGFRRLYRHYFDRVYAYIAYRVGRAADAEDIIAEVFLKVMRGLPDFEYRGEGSLNAWVFAIARREVSNFYRTHGRRPDDIPLQNLPEIQARGPLPDEHLIAKERFSRLRAMIVTLSPRRAEIVRLRFFAGLRNQEIAALLGIDERSVAAHLSRALKDLRHKYAEELEDR